MEQLWSSTCLPPMQLLMLGLVTDTAAFRFTVINFFNYRFPTLFTYKESILFCSKFICLCFFFFFLFFFLFLFFSFFSLSLFLATSRPFLPSVPFFFSRTRHRGCRAKARRRARNILAQLCFAPDDSQHYRSLGVDASFFLPYPGIPILLHTLFVPLLLPFFL